MAHRVLVVGDDRAIRDALGRALELEGDTVGLLGDGVEALARLRRRGRRPRTRTTPSPSDQRAGIARAASPPC